MSDIVPELLASIQEDFGKGLGKNKKISDLVKKVEEGTTTYLEADEYALEVGEILAKAFKRNISADILPDGKMYYNIAKRILEPTLKNNYDLITEVTKSVQETINKNAGIRIKAIKPKLNQDKVDGLIDAVSSADEYDKAITYLDEPVKNFSQSVVTDSIRVNAEFQHGAGLSPKIQRTATGKCCKWCQNLVGSYAYPDVPREVYQRHDYCRCKVDYVVGKERTNVHNNNTGKRKYVQDEYDTYKKSKEERIRHAEEMKATEKARKEAARQKRIETWKKKSQDNLSGVKLSELQRLAKDAAFEYHRRGLSGLDISDKEIEKILDRNIANRRRDFLERDISFYREEIAKAVENNGKHDKIQIRDIFIHKSIGAKSRNYDILDPATGEIFHFAEGTRIQNSEVFAGKGVRKPLHEGVAEGLAEQCGGTPEKWQHCKGDGIIDWYGEERPAEVHWFQEETVGKVKFKVKEWLDEG